MTLFWIGGFTRPVLELSLLFWGVMILFGLYYGLRFEDVDTTASDGDRADPSADGTPGDREPEVN